MPRIRCKRALLGAALVLGLLFTVACRSGLVPAPVERALGRAGFGNGEFTEQDLREQLASYSARFEASVVAAAEEIVASTAQSQTRRRALLWRLRMIPAAREAAFAGDPEAAFAGLLTLAISMHDYLTIGEGRELFGASQPVAVETSAQLLEAASGLGKRFLSDAQLARLSTEARALAREHPIRGVFVVETSDALAEATQPGGRLGWVVDLPLAPFRALQGVDTGAQAIREFNHTAQRFNQIAASLPLLVRWNLELLAYELEDHDAVRTSLAAFESLSRSAEELSGAAQRLPVEVRAQAEILLAQIDAGQGELRRTLEAARETLADAERTGQGLAPFAASLERTSGQLEQAGLAWSTLARELRAPREEAPGAAERPFDILDYEKTAREIQNAAGELRALVGEVRALSGARELDATLARVADTLGVAEAGTRGVVNLAAWRGLQLLLAFFVLLFAYRRVEARLGRGGRGGP